MRITLLMATLIAGLQLSPATAASLRIAPVLVDLSAPTSATTLRIWNDAQSPANVQVRIFQWSQNGGKDVFTPATDVVVSPPITKLESGGENMIRIVRTSKTPVRGEESYRVVIDELPQAANRQPAGTVNLVVRHSIPVFFSSGSNTGAEPAWSVRRTKGGYEVNLANSGGKRIRIANLALLDAGGTAVAKQQGLVGYVLGRSNATWFIPASGGKAGGNSLTISAESDIGSISARASVRGG
ncbi:MULTISPECIES: fimbrial biogenesis chaperone [unclassified Rhizobium]|uniref:fimbrial biogenesis chaperone n=1 Tax=unclassified Rhizobium TaxID=2613769 RepID=UPI003D28833A